MAGHRRVLPCVTYLITKKCVDDLFLLTPTKKTKRALRYELSRRAKRDGLVIHAFCFMSNHFHLVVTDRQGKLPAFMRDFLTNTSKALQVALGIDRAIWSRKRYSAVRALDLDAAERKIAYTLLNPTRAKLTTPDGWPGLSSARWDVGEVIHTRRPDFYFDPRYSDPSVDLVLAPVAPEFGLAKKKFLAASEARVRAHVNGGLEEARLELQRSGRHFLGAEAVEQTPLSRRGKRVKGEVDPLFASRDADTIRRALEDLSDFERDHQNAKRRYLSGRTKTVFPAGTYGYHVNLGVRVAKHVATA